MNIVIIRYSPRNTEDLIQSNDAFMRHPVNGYKMLVKSYRDTFEVSDGDYIANIGGYHYVFSREISQIELTQNVIPSLIQKANFVMMHSQGDGFGDIVDEFFNRG